MIVTDRRRFLRRALIGLAFPSWGLAQPTRSVRKVGIIVAGTNPRSAPFIAALERRLSDLGWSDGKNVAVEFVAGESREPLEKAVRRLVDSHVDVMVAAGPELGAQVAHQSTTTIPIVIVALNYDPVAKGYVKSLSRPGGNITGIYFRNPEVGAKELELLHAALPTASRIGLLWTRYSADQVKPVESAAARLGLQLEKTELRSADDINQAFTVLKKYEVGAAIALGDPIVYQARQRIASTALERRIPIAGQPSLADAGGLIGFGPDLIAAMAGGAEYVDKILRGATPDSMPIEQPAKFTLVVNLRTARLLSTEVPQSLLLRADEVIQ